MGPGRAQSSAGRRRDSGVRTPLPQAPGRATLGAASTATDDQGNHDDVHPSPDRCGRGRCTRAGRGRTAGVPERVRQRVRHRGAARHAAGRAQLAAARRLRAVRRAALGHRRSPRRARDNRRSWFYRIRPGGAARAVPAHRRCACCRRFDGAGVETPPNQLRWSPLPIPAAADGFRRRPGHDGRQRRPGIAGRHAAIHLYAANRSMLDRFFYDADGELLIVPQQGRLRLLTEMGMLEVEPQEIAVMPRGVRFRVELPDGPRARLRLRELRRAAAAAGPRPDRLQRPGQPARLPVAGRVLRGPRGRLRAGRELPGPAVGGDDRRTRRWTSSPGTATTRRTSTTFAASTPSARSASTTRTRRSSWCCSRCRTRRASTRSTS